MSGERNVAQLAPKPGAYGLAFSGIPPIPQLLAADDAWPSWTVRWERYVRSPGESDGSADTWDEERATQIFHGAGRVVIEREPRQTTLLLAEEPLPEEVVHPYLASTAIAAGHWLGRASFHAGAFALNGRVWGLLGERTMGKTSTLLLLHQMGIPVVTDDVLVLEDLMAFAGPRCLDLREDVAQRTGCGRRLGKVGTRERWRLDLPTIPGRLPLGGWVVLAWSEDRTEISVPPVAVRLEALAANRGLLFPNADAHGLLDLVSVPMLRFSRPRDWDGAPAAINQLVQRISEV